MGQDYNEASVQGGSNRLTTLACAQRIPTVPSREGPPAVPIR